MAPLTDPERLKAYKNALSNWEIADYIRFDLTEQSRRWVQQVLGVRLRVLARLMHEYVEAGGKIDEVRERRPEWSDDYEYHYDLRFSVKGVAVYVETRLNYRPPFQLDEPWILVVSVHAE
jgi:hypothetical protein